MPKETSADYNPPTLLQGEGMMATNNLPRWTMCPFAFLVIFYALSCPVNSATVSHEQENNNNKTSFPKSTNGSPFPWNKMRLPDHVLPIYYELLIHPNLTTLAFIGSTKIDIVIQRQTSVIVLHSKDLEITSATIKPTTGIHQPEDVVVFKYPPNEQIAFLTPEPLLTGLSYSLTINYYANFSQSFHGFYKSSYRTQNGEVRVLAATQFEPTAARMAFPCFDEPSFKAKFSVTIRRDWRHSALSNMPIVKSVEMADGIIEDHFDVSVKMSTYLVAFIVSDFKSISKMTERGVMVSVYTAPEKINQAEYALDAAVTLLEFYEKYFRIPYPLPKQDLVAVPDFQSGAMENWGLTTYRESALLFNPETSSASSKLGITMTVSHELAHQWFGNLVTMEWWNDLWLNEGFAKFMEYVSVNITHPDLQVEDTFLPRCFGAMEVDALNSSHPVSTPVENPAQILEMFDDVSYDKGACILNMLRDYMGADQFQAGIVQYLHRYSYQNTKNEDLWNSMTDLCPTAGSPEQIQQMDGFCSRNQKKSHWSKEDILDVKTMMNTWTLQKGFPLITVSMTGKHVHLKQEYYVKGSDLSQATAYLWHVPLTYITSESKVVQRFLLKTKKDVIILPNDVTWIKFNVGMNGYYIVHYEGDGWNSLINLLNEDHSTFSSYDRANLINNAFQLVSVGRLPIDNALNLTLYLKRESSIMPVFQGLNELIPIYKMLERREMEDLQNRMKAYIVNLFSSLIDQQSWSDDGTVSVRMLRSSLLFFACLRKYQPCVHKAELYFNKWKESNGTLSLPTDVKMAVYSTGAQTIDGWDYLFEKYKTCSSVSEKHEIEFALARSRIKEKLQWLLEQCLLDDIIKTQDMPYIVVAVGTNQFGHSLAWQFLQKNWKTFADKFGLGSHTIAHVVSGLTNLHSTKEKLEEVEGFFDALEENVSHLRCIQQAKETIVENIRWMEENLEKVNTWLLSSSS